MSKQPRDDGNAPIPVLSFRYNCAQNIDFTSTAILSAAFSPSVRVVTLYSTESCWVEIGDDTIVANLSNSHLIPAGMIYDVSLETKSFADDSTKYISVIGNLNGTLYISERE